MINLFWRLLAKLLAWRPIANYIIKRSQRTPYFHLDGYMLRWWVFNPYDAETHVARYSWCPWSIRVHRILREDLGRHLHDHPWNARTIILSGWYEEQRLGDWLAGQVLIPYTRRAGCTAKLNFNEYHHISKVSPGGVFTLFITGPKQGTWGFLVDGVKVEWRRYLGHEDAA
ncbi:hypothetical protein AX279_19560 [Pseudomonas sp. J237]|nr:MULTISPECIES: hypothetical protein [Pseudomonas]OEO24033.1 hypothetical protein AX279_19560 [Pseudomonas sp. J237]